MNAYIPGQVSTIIPVHNRPEFLEQSVRSVLDQTHRPIELILVDDGSTDGASAVVDWFAEQHPDVVFAIHTPHRGPGPARETGRLAARGEFLQYLDSDDRLHPRKFELQVAALASDCGADLAGGITRLVNEHGAVLHPEFKWTSRRLEHLFPGLLVDRWWCTHTPLYRRSLTDRIGAWSNLRYSQDWEYDARAGAFGSRIAPVDAVVSDHRHHGGPRQTGHGRWLTYPDQVRFFTALHACARRAGVPDDAPEMHHFGRWVFSHTRRAAITGNIAASDQLLELAESALPLPPLELRLYRFLRRATSARAAACISEGLRRLLPRRAGSATLPLSWRSA